jgi:hypothetical protein
MEVWFRAVMRAANGSEDEARRIISADIDVSRAIEDEDAKQLANAHGLHGCPFTSVVMCPACASGEQGPARKLSMQYEKLARDLDSELLETLDRFGRLAA